MKKRTKIIIIISVLIIFAVVLILILKPSDKESVSPPDINDGELKTSTSTSKIQEENFIITRLSDEDKNVFDFWEDSTTSEILYITPNGKIFSAKPGPDPEVSGREFTGINRVRKNYTNDKVLISFGNPKSPSWGVFDTEDRVWRPLPSYIQNITWSGDKVFAVVSTNQGNSLVSFDFEELKNNGEKDYKVLLQNFNFNDVDIKYVPDNKILIIEKTAEFYRSRVWEFNTENQKISFMISPERGLDLAWKNEVYFKYSSESNNFNILNKKLNTIVPLVFKTFPVKCGGGKNIYCFVPNNFPDNEQYELPDDYYKRKIYTLDTLYKINKESGETEKVLSRLKNQGVYLDGVKPLEVKNKLLFKNRYNNALYQINFIDTENNN